MPKLKKKSRELFADFLVDAIKGAWGKTRREILAAANQSLKPRLTPDQWKEALALLVQYLPLLITLLK